MDCITATEQREEEDDEEVVDGKLTCGLAQLDYERMGNGRGKGRIRK